MMSYLWILLLGSLLASHARAEGEANPEDGAPDNDPAAEDAAPEDDEAGDAETENQQDSLDVPQGEGELDLDLTDADAEDATEEPSEGEPEIVAPTEGTADADDVEQTEVATTVEPAGEEEHVEVATTVEPDEEHIEVVTTVEPDEEHIEVVTTVKPDEEHIEVATTVNPADDVTTTAQADTLPEAEQTTVTLGVEPKDAATTQAPTPVEEPAVSTVKTPVKETDLDDKIPPAENVTGGASDTSTIKPVNPTSAKGKGKAPRLMLPEPIEELVASRNVNNVHKQMEPNDGETAASEKSEEKEGGSGAFAGILSAIIVSAVAAVSGYFVYEKKKLCFKNRQPADPEAAHKADAAEAQSEPQVLTTLLEESKTQQ